MASVCNGSSDGLHFENIVIGSCLSAVLFSYYNNFPIVLNSLERPFRFDSLPTEVAFNELSTSSELLLWSWVAMEISMAGLCPFGPTASSIRVLESENRMSITTGSGINFKVGFGKCYIFDDTNVTSGLEILKSEDPLYRVFDWMNVRTGMVHEFEHLETSDSFVKKIYFYKSSRIDGTHKKKDLVSVSYLTEEQLKSFDFSDTMARFKIQKLMRDNGIKTLAGKGPTGAPRFDLPVVEPDYRYIINTRKNKYKDTKRVKFLDLTPEKVVKKYAPRR